MEQDQLLFKGRWLSLREKQVTRGEHQVNWEYIARDKSDPTTTSVSVLAFTLQTEQVLIVANFRYPINKYVLELPAGLTDPGEDVIAAGIREVKEETGYTVRPEDVIGQSPLVSSAPWLTSSSTNVVTVSVDLDLPENAAPAQQLDEAEKIKVLMVPKRSLLSSLVSIADQEGYGIDCRLYLLAQGLELAKF